MTICVPAAFHSTNVALGKTCLYMDDYAVRQAAESADPKVPGDSARLEKFVRYYFQPVNSPKLSDEDLNALWNMPLSDMLDSVDQLRDGLYTKDGMSSAAGIVHSFTL